MSDFTVFDVGFPTEAKQRVIVNTDAKNEADDQFAIVQAVLMQDLYEQVQPNLAKHDPRYPSADKLRSRTWQGKDGAIGTEDFGDGKYWPIESLLGKENETEDSEAIIRIVDKPDPRPVCVWGGSREVAQAI